MPATFTRTPDGGLEARLDREEVGLLRHLVEGLREVLSGDERDPAMERLFPRPYETPEESEDWTSMTQSELTSERLKRMDELIAMLNAGRERRGRWTSTLNEDQIVTWMAVVNDARLVLGVRLDVREDPYESLPTPGDPRRPLLEVYAYLGWLESEILESLDPGLAGPFDTPAD